ncbi:hypothetical protein SAMN06295885_3062 [Rathayibacter oskolensis]|uniref:HTH araC/xylS-type domain-containing protein n=1 Tax=Rathayibacter oskolensis TaxID=1891671 RepID=A0A1X7PBC7_9MICO|nr:hypothetical protein [Rathayibacter oskolensis]SMH48551.1 hypothetical protein SAMN06295885_3062 [Rathayibacter oskolensis]
MTRIPVLQQTPDALRQTPEALQQTPDLAERIDRSLLHLHTLPGLDARVLARVIGVPTVAVRTSHWLRRHSTLRASLARIRVEAAERLLHEQPRTLPPALVMARTAEAVGFHSTDEMDRAFLRYRHRSGFEALLAGRARTTRSAA